MKCVKTSVENKAFKKFLQGLLIVVITIFLSNNINAQSGTRYMRIARIVIDSAQLENYKAALKEGIQRRRCSYSEESSLTSFSFNSFRFSFFICHIIS